MKQRSAWTFLQELLEMKFYLPSNYEVHSGNRLMLICFGVIPSLLLQWTVAVKAAMFWTIDDLSRNHVMIVKWKTNLLCVIASTLILCLLSTIGHAQTGSSTTSKNAEDQAALFEWFDGLGFMDYSKLPLVRVTTGWWSQTGDEEPKNSDIYAFLIDEDKVRLRVYTLDLLENSFEFSPRDVLAHKVVKFEKVDLAETAKQLLREHAERKAQKDSDVWRRMWKELNEGSEFVVLARACAAQNEPELSQQLIDEATELLTQDDRNTGSSLKEALADDLAHVTMWRIVLDFGDAEVPRTELLARLELFRKHYPTSRHFARATETAELLQEMVREDREHKVPMAFDDLGTDEKVAELIFQLRNQNGQQWSQPGSCDIFFSDDLLMDFGEKSADTPNVQPKVPSPAQQLVDIGYDAVPQLIAALDDKRLTRSVGYHRNFYFSHHVLYVGDCAEQILSRIANRSFYQRRHTNAAMMKDGDSMTVKAQVEEWWREFKQKGERQVLLEGTIAGDENSPKQARQLIAKFPADALEAIRQGTANATSPWVRNQFIELSSSLGEAANVYLNDVMAKAPALKNRVKAATHLAEHNRPVAVEAMIAEWKALTKKESKSTSKHGTMDEGTSDLIRFLALQDSLDALQSLNENLHMHRISSRFEIATAFGRSEGSLSSSSSHTDLLNVPDDRTVKSHAVEKEIESFLITSLSDIGRREGLTATWNRHSFVNPRVSDVAGFVLAQRYPDKYSFDPSAIGETMKAQRIRAINVWRKENGQTLLPETQSHKIERIAAEVTDVKLAAIVSAADDRIRAAAIEDLLKLGLGALDAVLEAIEKSPKDGKAEAELRSLAKNLSSTVALVSVEEDSAAIDVDLKKRLDEFSGKPLEKEKLVDLFLMVVNELPQGSTGISVCLHRSNARSGIEMSVRLTTEWPEYNGTQQLWNIGSASQVDGVKDYGSKSSWSLEHAEERESFADFLNTVDAALNSPIEQPFEILFTMIRDEY